MNAHKVFALTKQALPHQIPRPYRWEEGCGGESLEGKSHSVLWEMYSWDSSKKLHSLTLFTSKEIAKDPPAVRARLFFSGLLVGEPVGLISVFDPKCQHSEAHARLDGIVELSPNERWPLFMLLWIEWPLPKKNCSSPTAIICTVET